MNRILLLIGAAQGWALWGLWKARELKAWPSYDAASERTLLYVSLPNAKPGSKFGDQPRADIENGKAKIVEPRFNDIEIDGHRFSAVVD